MTEEELKHALLDTPFTFDKNRVTATPLPFPPPISVEGLEEAMDAFEAKIIRSRNLNNSRTASDKIAARSSLKALFSKLVEGRDAALADVDEMDTNDVLQVLCRVFDDGADQGMEEWFAWYKPEQWFHSARALGAFIYTRLKPERDELSALRSEVASQEKEIKARGELYGRMCETLHDCCQKHHLGLGGEHVDRLVVEEIERLSADRLTARQASVLAELAEQHITDCAFMRMSPFRGYINLPEAEALAAALRRLSEQGENET